MSLLAIESRRKPGMDGVRGLAQIFGILLYINLGGYVGSVISPVTVPLFFAITGYLFRMRKQKEFYVNLILHLILPWLVLAMVPCLVGAFTRGPGHILEGVLDVIRGKIAWFMPCTVIARIIHYYIRKCCRNAWGVTFASVVCFGVGLVLRHFGLLNEMMINLALVAQLFLLIGYLFRKWEGNSLLTGWIMAVLAGVVYVGLCVLSVTRYPGSVLDVKGNGYYNFFLCLGLIGSGCMALLAVGHNLKKVPRWLSFLGQNTLLFYIWGSQMDSVVYALLSILGISLPGWLTKTLIAAMALLVCGSASILLNQFLPELVGKSRSKKRK